MAYLDELEEALRLEAYYSVVRSVRGEEVSREAFVAAIKTVGQALGLESLQLKAV